MKSGKYGRTAVAKPIKNHPLGVRWSSHRQRGIDSELTSPGGRYGPGKTNKCIPCPENITNSSFGKQDVRQPVYFRTP